MDGEPEVGFESLLVAGAGLKSRVRVYNKSVSNTSMKEKRTTYTGIENRMEEPPVYTSNVCIPFLWKEFPQLLILINPSTHSESF